jgi:hypothetical protein
MAKVFISGYVMDAALYGPMRGLNLRASVSDSSERHTLWQGTTDTDGAFGFELRPADHPKAHRLHIEVHHGRTLLAEVSVAWHTLTHAGAHVEFKITERLPNAHGEPPVLRFPIGFPGADRPADQHGPVRLELEQPDVIPRHPMAALPFLIQRSRPTDPDEGGHDTCRIVARPGPSSDPP